MTLPSTPEFMAGVVVVVVEVDCSELTTPESVVGVVVVEVEVDCGELTVGGSVEFGDDALGLGEPEPEREPEPTVVCGIDEPHAATKTDTRNNPTKRR